MILNRNDLITGGIFIGIGGFFAVSTLVELPIGTPIRMGPGFFPIVVSGLLVLVGLVVMLRSVRPSDIVAGPIPWRGLLILLSMPVLFGATIRGLGLVPTVFAVAFIATFASRKTTVRTALLLAAALTILSMAVFYFALRLPLRLFGTWLEPIIGVIG